MGSKTIYWCDRCGHECGNFWGISYEIEDARGLTTDQRGAMIVCGACKAIFKERFAVFFDASFFERAPGEN